MRKSLPLLLLALPCFAADKMPPAADQKLAHDIYQEMIEIKSGYTSGATTPVAEAVAARLKAAGFLDSDIFLGGANPKKGNIVVRYRGTGARKPVLLLAHTDVVEAKREDWSMDPFVFTEKDGFFYGRGTADDKAQAAIWVANLIRYKREGFKPDRDIIVALTADEEGGGPFNGADWLVKNHRDLIDAEYALNEGGFAEEKDGRKISNDLQISEKYVVNFRLEVHNKGGHSSMPVPDNAIYHLAGALYRLSDFGFPMKLNEVTKAYFSQMSKIESGSVAADLAKVAAGSQDAMTRVAKLSPAWNSMLRTTCVATELEGGHAKNALPQLAAANVNCRVLPEDSVEYVQDTLAKTFADNQVNITVAGHVERGPASPMNAEILKATARVTGTLWPSVPVLPVMLVGATDGLYLRSAGIPTYGIQGLFMDRNELRIHGRDERMAVKSFYEGQTFLYDLVKALCTPGS
jgi:acetylornithine deacetylase/succinyl-diaminopimelate desuccinylase-like protein